MALKEFMKHIEKIEKKYDLIIDIQGDEPLINPKHIDNVINFIKE